MLLIVDDSFRLSAQNPTLAERLSRARAWARVLFGIIPELRLQDSFDRAFQDHQTDFPVNAYEIKTAWEKIRSEEKEAALTAQRVTETPAETCSNRANHVEGEDVLCEYGMPGDAQLLPCHVCRSSAFKQRSAETLKSVPIERMVGEIEKVMQEKVDPETFLRRVRFRLNKEMVDMIDTPEYDNRFQVRKIVEGLLNTF